MRHITFEELEKQPDRLDPASDLYIDVREASEWNAGRIPGAIHLPLSALARGELTAPFETSGKRLIVYCHSGIRSQTAIQLLEQMGYGNLWNLHGGITRWRGPIVR